MSGVTGAHTNSPHNKILVLFSSSNKTVAETIIFAPYSNLKATAAHLTVNCSDSNVSAVCKGYSIDYMVPW